MPTIHASFVDACNNFETFTRIQEDERIDDPNIGLVQRRFEENTTAFDQENVLFYPDNARMHKYVVAIARF